jgi:phage terminase large subunit-like protein
MDPRQAAYLILRELQQRTEKDALDRWYPESGPMRRELYPKHMAMFRAGREHSERVCLGGNRVGKTRTIGAYETALHLTGLYPPWWDGRVFDKPIVSWAAGTKSVKVRDINQTFLLGKISADAGVTMATGGLVPRKRIVRLTRKNSVADAVDQVVIAHRDGYENVLTFKSYEEGRAAFEGEGIDWIWLDEEGSRAIYDECKMRLLTTRGAMLSTFTPVDGMTELVISLLEGSDFL